MPLSAVFKFQPLSPVAVICPVLLLAAWLSATPLTAAPGDVVITEVLYNADPTNSGGEFIEFHNRGRAPVDLSGWTLAVAVDFEFPLGTTLAAGGYAVVVRNLDDAGDFYGDILIAGEYSGALSNGGDSIELRAASGELIDQVEYTDSPPWPQEADGGGVSLELVDAARDNSDAASWGLGDPYSPGAPNAPAMPGVAGPVVISEIMYKPLRTEPRMRFDAVNGGPYVEEGDDAFGEYLELVNRSAAEVDLSGWRLSDGVRYEFPSGSVLAPGAFATVASHPDITAERHAVERVFGPFSGRLSDAGERITLQDSSGRLVNTLCYDDRHPWPMAPDEFGDSLECLDVNADNGTPANWRASRAAFRPIPPEVVYVDDAPQSGNTADDGWFRFSISGVPTSRRFFIWAGGESEWLIDGLELRRDGTGDNVLPNGSFETDDEGWSKRGSHSGSFQTTEDAKVGVGSEHLVATRRGNAANVLQFPSVDDLELGEPYVLSGWVKHLVGDPRLTLRFAAGTLRTELVAGIDPRDMRLASNWSDEFNPRGPWSLLAGDGRILEPTENWSPADLGPAQAAWTSGEEDGAVGWLRGSGAAPLLDLPAGTIATRGPSIVRWTSRGENLVTISGSAYLPRASGDANQVWRLQQGDHVLASGTLVAGDARVSAASPTPIAADDGNPIESFLFAGESIECYVEPEDGGAPDFVAIDLRIQAQTAIFLPPAPPLAGAAGLGTPSAANSQLAQGLPPLVEDLRHTPETPSSTDAVTIAARVTAAAALDTAALEYSFGVEPEVFTVDMVDDGHQGDSAAGDGIFGVRLPPQPNHTLVHYRVRVADVEGNETVFPYDSDPSPTAAYFHDDSIHGKSDIDTELRVFHLFVTQDVLDAISRNPRLDYQDASVAIDGIAYPHIDLRRRGRRSRAHAKNQWKFRFNRDRLFEGQRTLDTMINIPFVQRFAFQVFERAGIENLGSELVRVQMNGGFWGVYIAFESPNRTWTESRGLSPSTEIYKARSVETSSQWKNSDLFTNQLVEDLDFWGAWNKKMRPLEPPDDIRELTRVLNDVDDAELLPWLDRNFDLDQFFTRWSLYILLNIDDFGGHNFYLYRDPEGDAETRKWKQLAYDFDSGLTFGRVGALRALYGDGVGDNPDWQRNKLCLRVSRNATLRRIYLLKMRELLGGVYDLESLLALADSEFARLAVDREAENSRFRMMRESTAEMKNVMTMQHASMVEVLAGENLPGREVLPVADPPGGVFAAAPVDVTLSVPQGWTAVYTTDGSDPRLSQARGVFTGGAIEIATSSMLRVAAFESGDGAQDFDSGKWSDLSEFRFDITAVNAIGPFVRGDVDGDGALRGPSDVIFLLRYLFSSGDAVPCAAAADANSDGTLSVADAVRLLLYLYRSGPAPAAPFPLCGAGFTVGDGELGCAAAALCR